VSGFLKTAKHIKYPVTFPRDGFFFHKVEECLINPNIMGKKKSPRAKVPPGGSKFPYHVLISMKTVVYEAVDFSNITENRVQEIFGIPNM
jgi:hypothetical protein